METENKTKILLRVEDKTAEDDNAPIPLCKFCSKPMIRLPKTENLKAGYTCDCEKFQSYIHMEIELQNYKKILEQLEQKIAFTEQEMEELGRQSAYYTLVEDVVRKNMFSKIKTKKEKTVSFEEVKTNKDRVNETKVLTEKYYFYPYIT